MYSIQLPWKNFNIDLPSIEAWVKTQVNDYVGSSADSQFTLWFSTNDPEALPMHDVVQSVDDPAVPAKKAQASVGSGGTVVRAMNAGVEGNGISLSAENSPILQNAVDAWNIDNPDQELEIIGDETQLLLADLTLSGGADEVPEGSHDVTVSEPTGDPSVADNIRAHWDAIASDSDEALAYTQRATQAAILKQVQGIAAFSSALLNQFAAENIAMGITADNKTEDVLDIMLPVMNALQGGAPTVAIKRAKAISPSDYDAKYVTAARLLSYVNKIEAFLGLPLSESLS